MKLPLAPVLAVGLALSGCGKPPPPPAPSAPPAAPSGSVDKLIGGSSPPAPSAPAAPGAPATGSQPAGGGSPQVSSDDPLKTLNAAIKFYVERENRPPKTVEDLLEGGGLKTLPAAPPGMKFIIDRPTLQARMVKK